MRLEMILLNLQSAYAHLNKPEERFPVAEGITQKVISLPKESDLTEATQQQVVIAKCSAC